MRKNKQLRNFWYNLSANQRFVVRRLYYFPKDFLDKITGKRNKYVPPRGYIYTGSPSNAEDYLKQGEFQLDILKSEISLQPDDVVLDIGSGVGRTAIALSKHINANGAYEGFDVVEKGVVWCNKKIKKDFPNFNFTYIPLFNDLYNDEVNKANEFTFQYPDNHFDKIFSFSVFTHMQIDEIEHYFKEIKRVLKPNGKCLSTFFIYEDSNEDQIANKNDFGFPFKKDGHRLMNDTVKSGNIAIHLDKLNDMLKNADLSLVKYEEGFWRDGQNKKENQEYQDIIVFQ